MEGVWGNPNPRSVGGKGLGGWGAAGGEMPTGLKGCETILSGRKLPRAPAKAQEIAAADPGV